MAFFLSLHIWAWREKRRWLGLSFQRLPQSRSRGDGSQHQGRQQEGSEQQEVQDLKASALAAQARTTQQRADRDRARARSVAIARQQAAAAKAAATKAAAAKAVADAGAFCVVVEGVLESIAEELTRAVAIPTIGIGASPDCDGQVLVTDDMLGLFERTPRFVKRYADLATEIGAAAAQYREEVRARSFPTDEQTYRPKV